jgi:hypothetical protein
LQHPRARLSILVLTFVLPHPVLRMERAKINGIELDAFHAEFRAHERHQRVKIGLRIIAPCDSSLIRHDNQSISEPHCSPTERKDAVDKPHLLSSMQISHLFIYDPVPIQK